MAILEKTILTVLFRLASFLGIAADIFSVFKAKQSNASSEYLLLVRENGNFHVFPVKLEDEELVFSQGKACAP